MEESAERVKARAKWPEFRSLGKKNANAKVRLMKGAPWFKFFAADYLNDPDVDDLPLEAQAILVRMWAVLWSEETLPSDPEEIARKCKVRPAVLQMHMHLLMHFFVHTPDQKLTSVRMEKEKDRSRLTSDMRRKAAHVKHSKAVAANASANAPAKQRANAPAKEGAFALQRTEDRGTEERADQNQSQKLPPYPPKGGEPNSTSRSSNGNSQNLWSLTKEELKKSLYDIPLGVERELPVPAKQIWELFADAQSVEILDGVVYLSHSDPEALSVGLQRHQDRLRRAFEKAVGVKVQFRMAAQLAPPGGADAQSATA